MRDSSDVYASSGVWRFGPIHRPVPAISSLNCGLATYSRNALVWGVSVNAPNVSPEVTMPGSTSALAEGNRKKSTSVTGSMSGTVATIALPNQSPWTWR